MFTFLLGRRSMLRDGMTGCIVRRPSIIIIIDTDQKTQFPNFQYVFAMWEMETFVVELKIFMTVK